MTHTVAAHIHDSDPPGRFKETWTEEQVAILVRRREEGVNRTLIAEEINRLTGSTFTRSAVCGKIDRMFPVAKPIKTEEERAETKRLREQRYNAERRARRANQRAGIHFAPRPAQAPVLEVVKVDPMDFPGARVFGIDALESHHCRFICNDDMSEPVYCGLPIMASSSKFSWCAGHHALMTQKPIKTWGGQGA